MEQVTLALNSGRDIVQKKFKIINSGNGLREKRAKGFQGLGAAVSLNTHHTFMVLC